MGPWLPLLADWQLSPEEQDSTSLGHVTSTNDDKLKVSGRAQGHSIPVTFSAYFLDRPKPGCPSSTPTGHPWAEAGPLLPEAPFWLSVYDP